ncbi:EGF-like domain-containing protein [Cavenderia fasciculata]|uniref:EGF-like domain-containing protein n=1 Tax=Cavenderia fasciculata TaxID=261658 RepID=F4PH73_CACFS|nr:EGF-like domain-containing protein [Cavenderia fasciculata]EGG25057.1 EGF-like domain-containing protein [Cavenderia fasciculata]|eukprot:XP_004362908.1 EGF-like domain-containing protein [Cavenderia fasciculata]
MKMIISLLLIGMISISSVLGGCNQDYECGNQPFSICRNRFHLFPGIGLTSSGSILVMGKYNNSAGQQVGKTYIASVGSGSVSPQYPINSDVPSYPGYTQSFELYDVVGSTPYINAYQVGFPSVGPYNDQSGTFTPIWTVARYILGLYFDQPTSKTYYCDVGVYRIDKIASTRADKETATKLYADQRCNYLATVGSDLYILVNEYSLVTNHSIYRGSVNCQNCQPTNLIKLASFPGAASGFFIRNGNFFVSATNEYTNVPGIFRMQISNPTSRTALTSDSVGDVVADGNFAYYQTWAGYQFRPTIKKVTLWSTTVTTLYDEDTAGTGSSGTCSCLDGFSGANCQTCSGGTTRWTNNGTPTCVKLLASGQPETCSNGWECQNYPYTQCVSGACRCSEGFTGDRCDKCSGAVQWDNGFPTCKL